MVGKPVACVENNGVHYLIKEQDGLPERAKKDHKRACDCEQGDDDPFDRVLPALQLDDLTIRPNS